ncbi:hypothetical protein OG806_47935 [Streptomyces sp. NBC_00882]|uniref:hypothetical protein n=1 Tax=Streptomyces sp. NBC_00882 TaxID=2975856 RepID=UPI003862EB05|nr:hypothetical protein OG806_47935 [Streptomyces sp. NBC_00882]
MSVLDTLLPAAHRIAGPEEPDWRHAATDAQGVVDAICHPAAMAGLGKDFADEPDWNEAVVEGARRVTCSTNTAGPTA